MQSVVDFVGGGEGDFPRYIQRGCHLAIPENNLDPYYFPGLYGKFSLTYSRIHQHQFLLEIVDIYCGDYFRIT